MLKIVKRCSEMPKAALFSVCQESLLEQARRDYPSVPEGQSLVQAELDLWEYLQTDFFPHHGLYAFWTEGNHPVSVLRLEPYRDGLLLEALETLPEERCKGNAKALISAVQKELPATVLYSHVAKSNLPSLKVHKKCGFTVESHHAVFLDGSVSSRYYTLCCKG